MSFRGSFFFCSQHPLISSSSARAPLSLYCVRLVGAFELLSLRDTLASVRMTSHGAAIFLSGAPFANDGTLFLNAAPRPDIGPFQRSTGAGIPGMVGITASTEASYQLVQAVDLHERAIYGGRSSQCRFGDSQVDLSGAERSEAGPRAAFLAVETRVSISETLSFGATTSEAISRVDGVDGGPAGRQLHWNSR